MRRAIELQQPFVPGPPPKHSAQARANWRWFRALQDAIARGKSDREAIDEANAKVPEALEPTDERDDGRIETSAPPTLSQVRRPARRRSLRGKSLQSDALPSDPLRTDPLRTDALRTDPVRIEHSAAHELILPLGSEAFERWPGRPVPLE